MLKSSLLTAVFGLTVALASPAVVAQTSNTIELENFASSPVMLNDIRSKRSRTSSAGVAEQLAVGAGALAIDLFGGRTETRQQIFDEGQGDFAFAGVDGVGAGALQFRQIAQIRRARQDANAGIHVARRADHLGAVGHAGRVRIRLRRVVMPASISVSGRVASP